MTECLNKLIEKAPASKFGMINQNFIPKENATDLMYLFFSGGFLRETIEELLNTKE